METMLAQHLLGKRVAIAPDSTGREIAYKLLSSGYPGLPVVNGQSEIVGVVTEYDLLGAVKAGMDMDGIVADKIMSATPVIAESGTPVKKLVDMMIDNHFTVIPIVSNKKFVGVVSRQEIIDAYVDPYVRRLFRE